MKSDKNLVEDSPYGLFKESSFPLCWLGVLQVRFALKCGT